jgi:hypothetical protein
VSLWVQAHRGMIEQERHSLPLDLAARAMGQRAPVWDLAADKIGQAADAVVGVLIGDDNGDLTRRVKFTRTQRCADPGVTTANHDDMSHALISCTRWGRYHRKNERT